MARKGRKMSPAQEAVINANKFKPGTSGNPKGRPKEPEELKMKLHEFLDVEGLDRLFRVIRESDNPMAVIKGVEFAAKYVLAPLTKSVDINVNHNVVGEFLANFNKRRAELELAAPVVEAVVIDMPVEAKPE